MPDGEDMFFHESPEIVDGSDLRLYRVGQQPRGCNLLKRVQLTLAEPSCCCFGTLASIGIRTIDPVCRIVVEAPGMAGNSRSINS
jgi:hypothetical protein